MRYFLKIFGCQMNYSDAERIATILEKYKLKPAASIDAASLIVFVTCGVRQSAEDRAYGQINNFRKKYPKKKIILTGCLAHRKDVQRRLKGKVDLFAIIKDFPKLILPVIASEAKQSRKQIKHGIATLPSCSAGRQVVARDDKSDYLQISPKYTNPHTAYVPIMTGCNNFCAYCVVPAARGREYSRPAGDILREVKSLVKKGYKEIILLGQNVNSYNSSSINFPGLLKQVEKISGKFWITFLTSHPKDMSDELIDVIARNSSASGGKICEYISLPAQSGDNEILRKMNRHYTIEHYKKLVKKIRQKLSFGELRALARKEKSLALKKTFEKLPPAISTDIIVGFPGETRKQFENTAKLLREMKFDMVYISQYSPRPETLAWKLKDNVPKYEKVRREKALTKILEKTALENNKKYIGKVVEVLVDKRHLMSNWTSNVQKIKYLAHTRTRKKVVFFSNKKIPVGKFVKVKMVKVKAFGLEGEMF